MERLKQNYQPPEMVLDIFGNIVPLEVARARFYGGGPGKGRGNARGTDLSDICDEVHGDDGRSGRSGKGGWGHHTDNASQGADTGSDSAGGSSGYDSSGTGQSESGLYG